jgi:hypothetical protein
LRESQTLQAESAREVQLCPGGRELLRRIADPREDGLRRRHHLSAFRIQEREPYQQLATFQILVLMQLSHVPVGVCQYEGNPISPVGSVVRQ